MMNLELIDRLAALSHLSFEGEEKEKMTADMARIIALMDTITAASLPQEESEFSCGGQALLREDEAAPSLSEAALLSNASEAAAPFFAVKKLMD